MITAFKSLLRDSNASLKLVEQDKLNIKVFEITIPNPKNSVFIKSGMRRLHKQMLDHLKHLF